MLLLNGVLNQNIHFFLNKTHELYRLNLGQNVTFSLIIE